MEVCLVGNNCRLPLYRAFIKLQRAFPFAISLLLPRALEGITHRKIRKLRLEVQQFA